MEVPNIGVPQNHPCSCFFPVYANHFGVPPCMGTSKYNLACLCFVSIPPIEMVMTGGSWFDIVSSTLPKVPRDSPGLAVSSHGQEIGVLVCGHALDLAFSAADGGSRFEAPDVREGKRVINYVSLSQGYSPLPVIIRCCRWLYMGLSFHKWD